MHRTREAYAGVILKLIADGGFEGVTEVDETAVGGRVKSMSKKSYRSFKERGGTVFKGNEIVIGAKNRETGKVYCHEDDLGNKPLQGFVEKLHGADELWQRTRREAAITCLIENICG